MRPADSEILVVEDDLLFTSSMRALLVSAGYRVRTVGSSIDPALPGYIDSADLVILDLAMPERDGFAILHDIRGRVETASKPVIMLTAHDPMQYRLRGLSLGADDFVVKPPNPQELLLRIAGILRRSVCASPSSRVVIDNGNRREFIDARDIFYVEAARNYCYVHSVEGRRLSSVSISQLEATLGDRFVRTHRSYLVNLAHVRGARWESKSSWVLDLDSPDEVAIPVSRAYRESVRAALGFAERPALAPMAVTA